MTQNLSNYRTLSEAHAELRKRGYSQNFKFKNGYLHCIDQDRKYLPDEVEIHEYHRFEGESNPADMSIIFALTCQDGLKGTVVSSFGPYANMRIFNFMDKVRIADRTSAAGTIRKQNN